MKHIAVLLTVHNRKKKTLMCLQHLYEQNSVNGYSFDVWLTDDGCTDGTSEAVTNEFPYVHIIKGDGSLFWNRGMFTAWEAAAKARDYDYYLWLNDDTFAYPNMLSSLTAVSEEKGNEAIIVGATQDAKHSQTTYGGRLNNAIMPVPNGMAVEVNYFNGNIVLIPATVYHTLGNQDYYFTHSKGDFDYGMRARQKGIKMFQAGKYLGECELHGALDQWCDPAVPLSKRLKILRQPNGMPPKETFYFERRHLGLLHACFHYCTIYIRCFFPYLWYKRNRKEIQGKNIKLT